MLHEPEEPRERRRTMDLTPGTAYDLPDGTHVFASHLSAAPGTWVRLRRNYERAQGYPDGTAAVRVRPGGHPPEADGGRRA